MTTRKVGPCVAAKKPADAEVVRLADRIVKLAERIDRLSIELEETFGTAGHSQFRRQKIRIDELERRNRCLSDLETALARLGVAVADAERARAMLLEA